MTVFKTSIKGTERKKYFNDENEETSYLQDLRT